MKCTPYGRKFWREFILADCLNFCIWRNLLWRFGKACAIMIFIAKWLIRTNRARLLKSLWGVHALLFDHNWIIFVPILSFPQECCNIQRLLSLLLADLLTLAPSLWPRTQLYRCNAETENRLPKSAAVSYRQWSQRQSSQRPHIQRRLDCPRLPRALLPPRCAKLFGNVVSSCCCQLWT